MKNKTMAGFLALFLGAIGGHKFYLDRPGTGLMYLLLCWTFIPAIIALFEGLSLFFMSNERFNELYNSDHLPNLSNMPENLEKLYQLKEKGIITEEEYFKHKARLLK